MVEVSAVHVVMLFIFLFVLVFGAKESRQKSMQASGKDKEMPATEVATPAPATIPVRRVPPKVGTAQRHVFTDKAQYLVHDLEGGETLLEEISQGRVVNSTVHRKVADEVIREIFDLAVPIRGTKAAVMPKASGPMAVRVQKRISGPAAATAA